MNTKSIHIGQIIKQKLSESPLSIKEFANRIHCDRTTVYDIFKRKSIDVECLLRISQALNYDFIHEIYFNETAQAATSISSEEKVFIAVEINKIDLRNLTLPDDFIQLVRRC